MLVNCKMESFDELPKVLTGIVRANERSTMLKLPQSDFDAEINAQFASEKSRTVKVCMLKYRCIIMFTFMLLSFLQFCYIMFRELFSKDEIKDKLFEMLEKANSDRNSTT